VPPLFPCRSVVGPHLALREAQRSLSAWCGGFLRSPEPGSSALGSMLWDGNSGCNVVFLFFFFFTSGKAAFSSENHRSPELLGAGKWAQPLPFSFSEESSADVHRKRDPSLIWYRQPMQSSPCFREGLRPWSPQCTLLSPAARRSCWVLEPLSSQMLPGDPLCCPPCQCWMN